MMCLILEVPRQLTLSLAHTTLYIQKPSLRAVAQPIENVQDAAFNAVAKHSSRDEWRDTDSSNDTDMEMIATEVENNRAMGRSAYHKTPHMSNMGDF